MKKSFVSALAVLVLVPAFSFAQDAAFPPFPSTPTVAHRGFSAAAPENTLSSVMAAVEVGAQGCEFDIYQSKDGVVYLNHDGKLKRTTGLDKGAGEATFEELRQLDFGAWKGEQFKGEKLTTYDEALAVLKYTGTRPVVEVKANGFEDKVVDGLRRFDLIETAIVIDFSADRVKKYRELEPKLCVAWLTSLQKNETRQQCAQRIIKTLKEINTNVVDVHFGAVDAEFLKTLKDAGIRVMCWTVNNPADIQRMVDLGVESITTDRPDLVLEAQKKAAAK
ncbi:MAG: hypothetical protein IJO46_08960 [Thermoguttaceae bacterium]|nr:hypothetical protein [Thermoguttaceae bacterium]